MTYMHSVISDGGTRAECYDPTRGQKLANVFKRDGNWEALCALSGARLIAPIPHIEMRVPANAWNAKTALKLPCDVPLGEILKVLRPVLLRA